MSLKDEHLDDATVVGRGEFRLDRRRAMEKLAKFQLGHPHRYVLELVATAVRAGATCIRVRNDADDFEIEWDGDHPTADELEVLFDHIFTRSAGDRARMLQHLAQGIHGALGLDVKWVHLERPGALVDLSDPLAVTVKEAPRREGVFVHVRERFGLAVLAEWARPFALTEEEGVLREDAAWCPIPIEVNGEPLRRPLTGAPPMAPNRDGLWLAEDGDVALVRDGIRVETLHLQLGRLRLEGHVMADGLKLNASRSKAIRDKSFKRVQSGLMRVAAELIREELSTRSRFSPEDLRRAALEHLLLDVRGPLADAEVLADGTGRLWSLDGLRSAPIVRRYSTAHLATKDLGDPQFPDSSYVLALLDKAGVKTRGSEAYLKELAQGRSRRAKLRASVRPLSQAGALHEQLFEDEGLRGSAAFGVLGEDVEATLELRVEGLPVEVVALGVPGPISVRVESDRLQADTRFRRVLSDTARTEVVARCVQEAERLLAEVAARHPRRARVKETLLDVLASSRPVTDAVLRCPLFDTMDEGVVSLETLRAWSSQDGGLKWARASLILPFQKPRVLHPEPAQLKALRRRFRRLEDITPALEDELIRQRRLSSPPIPPRIAEYVVAKATVQGEDFRGEIGLGVERGEDRTQVRVLLHGVDLGILWVPLQLPSTVATLELHEAEGNARMDGIVDAQRWTDRLSRELVGPMRALVLASLEPPEPEAPLQAWLEGALRMWRPLPSELRTLRFARYATGDAFALRELHGLKEGPIEYLPHPTADCPVDFRHVLVLDASRRRVLQSFSGRALRDVSQRLHLRQEARARFLARTLASAVPTGDVVALRSFEGDELRVVVALSVDPDREPSLRVRVMHEDRQLSTEILPFPLPAEAVVSGGRVLPDPLYNGLQDRHAVLGAVLKHAEDALEDWVGFAALPAPARRTLLLYLLRLATRSKKQTAALEKLRAFPLFPRMDGRLSRLDELGESVVIVPERLAGLEAPDDRIWLLSSGVVRRILEADGIDAVQGRALLDEYEKGRARRESLAPASSVPRGIYPAFRAATDGDASIWIGLSRNDTGMDWIVEGRRIMEEKLKERPVRIRVTDPALRPSPDFTRVAAGKELTRSRKRATQLADEFLADLTLRLSGESVGGLLVLDDKALLPGVLEWAARAEAELVPDVPILATTSGEKISIAELRRQAAQGSIRIAGSLDRGMPADPTRPVISLDPLLWPYIRAFGPLEQYADALRKEVAARARGNAAPVQVEPVEDPDIVYTIEIEGEREGFLQVHRQGRSEVWLHVGWRSLSRIAHKGPVPLVGHVSDPEIEPDETWSGPVEGPELDALRRFLEERSALALSALLDADERGPIRLWLGILQRSFKHRRDMPKPGGSSWKSRLAGRPLIPTARGELLSPADVVALRQAPRWVSPAIAAPSPEVRRPFLVLERPLIPMAISFFGGELDEAGAAEARQIQHRRQRGALPFVQDGVFFAERRIEGKGYTALVALSVDLEEGLVSYRCEGVPVSVEELPLPGFSAIVEIEEARPDFTGPRADRARDEALRATYSGLLQRSLRSLQDSWFGRQKLAEVLPTMKSAARKHWTGLPLFETGTGWASAEDVAASIAQHGVVLYSDAFHGDEGPLRVNDERVNRALMEGYGYAGQSSTPGAWFGKKDAEAVREEMEALEARRAQAEARLEDAVRKRLVQLLDGLVQEHGARRLAEIDELSDELRLAAVDDLEGPGVLLAAWFLADRALRDQAEFEMAQEVAIRLGERLAGARAKSR